LICKARDNNDNIDEDLPEGVEEQTVLMPAKKLSIICIKCKKELDLRSAGGLKIDFDSVQCTNPLVFLMN